MVPDLTDIICLIKNTGPYSHTTYKHVSSTKNKNRADHTRPEERTSAYQMGDEIVKETELKNCSIDLVHNGLRVSPYANFDSN